MASVPEAVLANDRCEMRNQLPGRSPGHMGIGPETLWDRKGHSRDCRFLSFSTKKSWVLSSDGKHHSGQEPGSRGGFRFVHDAFEVFLHRVLTQIQTVRDFLIGKTEHEIDDHHLLALRQVISVLHTDVWTSHLLMQSLNRHKHTAIAGHWFVGNTKAAQ